MKTLAQLYLDVRQRLMLREEEQYAAMVARELVCNMCGKSHEQFLLEREQTATDAQCAAVEDALLRLLRDEPLAYVLGQWSFYGLELTVDPNVLIPRDDSCALAELAMRKGLFRQQDIRILDLCTGSGCIGLAVASRLPSARVILGDISPQALAVAKKNVTRHRMGGRVYTMTVDALKSAPPVLGKFHMIVSNPPYITTEEMKTLPHSVAAFEPHLALHGGEDGLLFYRAIVENFTGALHPGGYLAFEFGEGQGDAVCAILQEKGYSIVDRVHDFNKTERAVLAQYHREEE